MNAGNSYKMNTRADMTEVNWEQCKKQKFHYTDILLIFLFQ